MQKNLNSKEKESKIIKNDINRLRVGLKIALTKRKENNNYKINKKQDFKTTIDLDNTANIEINETEKIEILSNKNYKDFAEIIVVANKIEEQIKNKKLKIISPSK